MIIYATKLIRLPIIDPESLKRIGIISNCIFDPDHGKLVAIEIASAGLFTQKRYVSFFDLTSIERHAVLLEEDKVLPIEELPKIDAIIQSRRPILFQTARTTNSNLGMVVEIVFEITTGRIIQIHTQKLFRRRIFAFKDVDKITQQAVFISHDSAQHSIMDNVPEAAPKIA